MRPVQLGRFQPMHPTLVAQPFHRPGWVYEEKYDGWRMLAYKDGRTVRLVSRGRDHTSTFPDIALAVASLPAKTLVLDGEVCVFDCLYLRGRHLRDEPLLVRRRAVDATVGDRNMLLFAARRLAADGLAAWADVERRGLEGLVAKHEASSYLSGERSSLWRKVKRRLVAGRRHPRPPSRVIGRGEAAGTPVYVLRPSRGVGSLALRRRYLLR